ncbi:hypothetical protein B0H63DRAFT_477123 [Podospora didyma]|uniref:Uncharacterized protein n=1 Tax=Podospora didyma TaxID=330526 RepID=A0AAE0TWB3_9PEZI|nr:hypothetical protein B0H63DRAFT_477123 [Podospora didyma]
MLSLLIAPMPVNVRRWQTSIPTALTHAMSTRLLPVPVRSTPVSLCHLRHSPLRAVALPQAAAGVVIISRHLKCGRECVVGQVYLSVGPNLAQAPLDENGIVLITFGEISTILLLLLFWFQLCLPYRGPEFSYQSLTIPKIALHNPRSLRAVSPLDAVLPHSALLPETYSFLDVKIFFLIATHLLIRLSPKGLVDAARGEFLRDVCFHENESFMCPKWARASVTHSFFFRFPELRAESGGSHSRFL